MDIETGVGAVLSAGAIRTVFQPIIDLDDGGVIAYEALSRGPVGAFERPDMLFAAAERDGLLGRLDALCRTTALKTATSFDWPAEVALFVNVEPKVLDVEPLDELIQLARSAPHGLQVVLEITERAISARPAELLSCVRKLRLAGWRIALDDVGADDMSLAFMPLLRPDVVKLDLKLVQERPGPAVARIMNAVNAYAQRTGAVLLAEGIEDEEHLEIARALGARLGQGWLFGRPSSTLHDSLPTRPTTWAPPALSSPPLSPFECLPAQAQLRTSTKPLLVEFSKHLEQEALDRGATCVVVSTFQYAHHFTPQTAQRYERLATELGFVAAIGRDLPPEPAPGVRGAHLEHDDPLCDEWDIIVLAPHFAAALLARDLGDEGPDLERRFEFELTYDRDVVTAAAESLLSRVVPVQVLAGPGAPADAATDRTMLSAALTSGSRVGTNARGAASTPLAMHMLRRALEATTNGVTIADVTETNHPLVFVNSAFERLAGLRADQVLGTNCRFMQGPDTDVAAINRIREAIAHGREHHETILNYRHGSQEPWWNEIHFAPIHDTAGNPTHYIGVQNDVTARVEAELALDRERARSRVYLAEMESLAFHDPLTGLLNRRRVPDLLNIELSTAHNDSTQVALLYLDVDHFKAVNDNFGHLVGDTVLCRIGEQLHRAPGCLKARIGGDEFLLVLTGLDPFDADRAAASVATELRALLRDDLADYGVSVSVGISTYPVDGADFDSLLNAADRRMYHDKALRQPISVAGVSA